MPRKKKTTYEVVEDQDIKDQEISTLFKEQMTDYSKAVNLDRAIPTGNDGLKPSQRSVMFTMYKNGMNSLSRHMKTARLAGNTMAFHPHGDSSIISAIRGLVDVNKNRLPLIDMQGSLNAAARYTEVRPSKAADMLLEGLKKNAVEMIQNFDGSELQPVELPAPFPLGIINGTHGIGYAMASDIIPHNPIEVLNAAYKLVDNDLTDKAFAKIVKGPDFPTGGEVLGTSEAIKEASHSNVTYVVRGKAEITEDEDGAPVIYITELPYGVDKSKVLDKITEISEDNRALEVVDIADESLDSHLRLAIHFSKKATLMKQALGLFYRYSELEVKISANNNSIINGQAKNVGLKEYIKNWLEFRKKVLKSIDEFDLEKINERLHILNALVKMTDHLDDIIKIIRKSHGRSESKKELMERFDFDDIQASYITGMALYRINADDIESYIDENDKLEHEKAVIVERNSSEESYNEWLKLDIKNTIKKIKAFDWMQPERLTKIIPEDEIEEIDVNIKKIQSKSIPSKDAVVIVREDGVGQRMTPRVYENNIVKARTMKPIVAEIETKTNDWFMFFTNDGGVITRRVIDLQDGNPTSDSYEDFHKEIPDFKFDQTLIGGASVTDDNHEDVIVSFTKLGLAKVNTIEQSMPNVSNRRYLKKMMPYNGLKKRDDGDEVSAVIIATKEQIDNNAQVIIKLKDGNEIKVKLQDLSNQSAGGSGSRKTPGFDRSDVVSIEVIDNND